MGRCWVLAIVITPVPLMMTEVAMILWCSGRGGWTKFTILAAQYYGVVGGGGDGQSASYRHDPLMKEVTSLGVAIGQGSKCKTYRFCQNLTLFLPEA